jgi:MFS family permease
VLTTFLIYGSGGSNSDLGRILGTATMIGIGFTFVSSYLADTYRLDFVLIFAMLLQVVGVYLLSIADSLDMIFIGQLLYTAGASGLYPIITAIFSMSIPSSMKNRVFGTNFLAQNIFSAAGSIIAYFALKGTSADSVESIDTDLLQRIIKFAFYILIVVTFFLFFLDIKNVLTEEEETEGAFLSKSSAVEFENRKWYHRLVNPAYFERNAIKILGLSLISSYFIGFGAGISIPYLPRFFFDIYEIDLANLNLLFAGMTIITAIWGKINANLADKHGRNQLIVVNQMVSVTLLLILSSIPPLYFAFLALIVRNAAMNGTGPLFSAIQMDYCPRKYRSQINALNSIAWGMFFAIGQIIGGIIVDSKGFTPPLLLTATLYFLATLPFLKIKSLEISIVQTRKMK